MASSRKDAGKTGKGAATPRQRRTRTSAREAHYRSPQSDPAASPSHHSALTARDWYHREKERRANRQGANAAQELLEEARREFQALLAAEAGTSKGGRPRKNPPVVARKRATSGDADWDVPGDDAAAEPGAADDE